jgi:hypothetical protein
MCQFGALEMQRESEGRLSVTINSIPDFENLK